MKLAIYSYFNCFDGCTLKNNALAFRTFENSTQWCYSERKSQFSCWETVKIKDQTKKEKQRKRGKRNKRNHSFISDLFFSFGPRRAFFALIFVKKSRQFNRIFWRFLGSYLMKRKKRKLFLYHWHSVLRTIGKSAFTVIQNKPNDHTNSLNVLHKGFSF